MRSLAQRVPDSAQAGQNLLPVAAEGEVLAQARIAGTEAATGVEGDLQIESGLEAEPRESVAGPPGIGNLRCVESGDIGLFGGRPLNVWLPAARGRIGNRAEASGRCRGWGRSVSSHRHENRVATPNIKT